MSWTISTNEVANELVICWLVPTNKDYEYVIDNTYDYPSNSVPLKVVERIISHHGNQDIKTVSVVRVKEVSQGKKTITIDPLDQFKSLDPNDTINEIGAIVITNDDDDDNVLDSGRTKGKVTRGIGGGIPSR